MWPPMSTILLVPLSSLMQTAQPTPVAPLAPVAPALSSALMDNLWQIVVVVVLPFLANVLRNYANATKSEKNVDTIVRLASAAIDYVEHVNLRHDLNPALAPEAEGMDKLAAATAWMAQELKRTAISMPEAEIRQWVQSELQRRVADVPPTQLIQQVAEAAITDVVALAESGRLQPPPGSVPLEYWTQLAADRLLTQLITSGTRLSRVEAETWVRSAWLDDQLGYDPGAWHRPAAGSPAEQLERLSANADTYVGRLQSGGLSIRGDDADWYLRVARMLTEAARQGLDLSVDEVFAAAKRPPPSGPPSA